MRRLTFTRYGLWEREGVGCDGPLLEILRVSIFLSCPIIHVFFFTPHHKLFTVDNVTFVLLLNISWFDVF